MWHAGHDLSATQVHHPSINAYQHYSTSQLPHHHSHQNLSKWNVAGQRSSYSLPHPGHAQSNMRWQKHDEKQPPPPPSRHLSSSTRNLTATPPNQSFLHSANHDGRPIYGVGAGGGGGRQRPASMYDTPNMPNSMPIMGYHHHQQHQNGFKPLPVPTAQSKKDGLKHQQQQQQQQQKQHHHHQQQQSQRNGSIGLRQSPGELVRKNKF